MVEYRWDGRHRKECRCGGGGESDERRVLKLSMVTSLSHPVGESAWRRSVV
jgi:hypothetical protein